MSDFGLMMGLASRPRRFSVGAALGLGVVRDSRDSTAFGIPLEAFATVIASNNAAMGLRLFSNGNDVENVGGLTLTLHIGRLRRP